MNDRVSILRRALERRAALVVPGCHDALSARIVESAGFQAVQVSGFGVAGSLLGKPDVGLVDLKDVLDITGHIVRAVRIPVMADIDTGGGNAINAASITERLIEMGVARVSIPVASIMVMHKALKDFFTALRASPTGILAGETERITGFKEYTAFVGLPEYRALEREYLPAKE